MSWTTEKPTKPGWYWHRGVRSDQAEVVRVVAYVQHNSTLSLYYAGSPILYTIPYDGMGSTGEWHGPITPEEGEG